MFNGVVYENNHYMTPPVVYDYNKDWVYDQHAPWTKLAQMNNNSKQRKERVIVPPLKEWLFFRGDKVQIMTGKDTGRQGIINAVIRQRNWVFVQGLNTKLHCSSPTENPGDRDYMQQEKPLVVNKDVKLIDPSDFKPCNVTFRFTEKGDQVRVSTRTGHVLPIPLEAEATMDYAKKSAYKPGDKDTIPELIIAKTFQPKYKSFEQDLTDEYGLETQGERAETYVY